MSSHANDGPAWGVQLKGIGIRLSKWPQKNLWGK